MIAVLETHFKPIKLINKMKRKALNEEVILMFLVLNNILDTLKLLRGQIDKLEKQINEILDEKND